MDRQSKRIKSNNRKKILRIVEHKKKVLFYDCIRLFHFFSVIFFAVWKSRRNTFLSPFCFFSFLLVPFLFLIRFLICFILKKLFFFAREWNMQQQVRPEANELNQSIDLLAFHTQTTHLGDRWWCKSNVACFWSTDVSVCEYVCKMSGRSTQANEIEIGYYGVWWR